MSRCCLVASETAQRLGSGLDNVWVTFTLGLKHSHPQSGLPQWHDRNTSWFPGHRVNGRGLSGTRLGDGDREVPEGQADRDRQLQGRGSHSGVLLLYTQDPAESCALNSQLFTLLLLEDAGMGQTASLINGSWKIKHILESHKGYMPAILKNAHS